MPTFGTVSLPWDCKPELLVVAQAWHPAFTGEAKSVDARLFEELAVYAMLGMQASLFAHSPEGHAAFFPTPPRAYGLAAFPHVGYLVAVEWVARASLHIVSEPFFLGSEAHAAAVAALPDYDYEREAVQIDTRLNYAMFPDPEAPDSAGMPAGALIAWSAAPLAGRFHKIIAAATYPQSVFRRMHGAYTLLEAACAAARGGEDPPPPAILDARLLYGAGAVCVDMAWAPGEDAAPCDLDRGGDAVRPVAEALAWLARHGLLYLDLRLPNVRVARAGGEGAAAVALVDYDDIVPATAAVTSLEGLREQIDSALRTHFPGWSLAVNYLDQMPALEEALAEPHVWAAGGV